MKSNKQAIKEIKDVPGEIYSNLRTNILDSNKVSLTINLDD